MSDTKSATSPEQSGGLARVAARFTEWTERWIPDAFVFALVATFLVVIVAAATAKQNTFQIIDIWGNGFWELIPFTMQMALVIITGYVVASTQPVYKLIRRLAAVPQTPRGAVAFVALFAMLSS